MPDTSDPATGVATYLYNLDHNYGTDPLHSIIPQFGTNYIGNIQNDAWNKVDDLVRTFGSDSCRMASR
jgi:hypothetical protein